MTKKSVYIYSNGCSSNLLDGERMSQYFEQNGYTLNPDYLSADIIVINTCAFDAITECDSIEKVKMFQRQTCAHLIVCGCLPAINKEKLDEIYKGDSFIPESDQTWSQLDQIIQVRVPISEIKDPSILSHRWKEWKLIGTYKAFKENPDCKKVTGYDEDVYHIRIATGCAGKCSFCAIRYARGFIKSKSVEEILADFKYGIKIGYKSFKIWADDVLDYGLDIRTNLSALLEEILKIQENFELEILAGNPNRFLTLYDKLSHHLSDKRVRWLNLSIQSGSPRILNLMNRSINLNELTTVLRELKKKAPHLIIRAHYLVGFPSESWRDIFLTLLFTYKIRLFKYLILIYDPKPNTPAAAMPFQISDFRKNMHYVIMKIFGKLGSIIFEDGNTY